MRKLLFMTIVALTSVGASAKTVHYELSVTNQAVNLSGRKTVDFALMVNGGIPAPTLEFTEGDEAEIVVKNGLVNEEVSIHWHGLLLPPEEDGVAYVNTPPIFPGKSRTFRFKLRQHGTYWYHSHTMLQEQKGVFGAIVIHPKKESIKVDKEIVAVLSDWSDENADQIIRNLRKDGDYYLYKKDAMRSIGGAIQAGSLKNYFANEWIRMGGMDLSDVGYDAFLINGKRDSQLLVAHPGERVRLRLINAAASSYFFVSLSGLPMRVVSADGVDIEPVEAKELLMGMAETYDVLFTVPEQKSYELRATAQDVSGFASGWIGMGEKVPAPDKARPNLYASMDHSAHGGAGGHEHHSGSGESNPHSDHGSHASHGGHAPAVEALTVDELKAQSPTTLPEGAKRTELELVLGGDMERYVWHINGKAIHEDREIPVNEGDVIRFRFQNNTMMHHPMHLHGHFFRVLNQHGERSPLKHTVDVPPHGSRTIEFYANEPGQWMLHCHNLYHMKSGMSRVVKYLSYKPSPELTKLDQSDPHRHDHIYTYGLIEASTNLGRANLKLMRTWEEIDLRLESRNKSQRGLSADGSWDFEGDVVYRRWMGNFLNLVVGGTLFNEKGYGVVGVGYTLPMLIHSQILLNHEGKFRLDLGKRLQWTKVLFTEAELKWRPQWKGSHETESEYEISLMYGPSWTWSAGFILTNNSLGLGAHLQF